MLSSQLRKIRIILSVLKSTYNATYVIYKLRVWGLGNYAGIPQRLRALRFLFLLILLVLLDSWRLNLFFLIFFFFRLVILVSLKCWLSQLNGLFLSIEECCSGFFLQNILLILIIFPSKLRFYLGYKIL